MNGLALSLSFLFHVLCCMRLSKLDKFTVPSAFFLYVNRLTMLSPNEFGYGFCSFLFYFFFSFRFFIDVTLCHLFYASCCYFLRSFCLHFSTDNYFWENNECSNITLNQCNVAGDCLVTKKNYTDKNRFGSRIDESIGFTY